MDFWIGAGLMLGGTVLQNVGLGLMKYAHLQNYNLADEDRKQYWQDRQWYYALALFLSGAVMDFVALGLLPASVALPIGGIGLSVSGLFASRYLGETFTNRDKIGTVMIIVGSWGAIVFSNKSNRQYDAESLANKFSFHTTSGLYILFVFVLLVALIQLHKYKFRNAIVASLIPGSMGAFGNICGKGTAELVNITLQGDNQFVYTFTYVYIAATVLALVTQNHHLQYALATYDQVIVVPIYYVAVCFFSVLGGILFFGEWEETSASQNLWFLTGVGLVFSGVWFLTKDHLNAEVPLYSKVPLNESFDEWDSVLNEDEVDWWLPSNNAKDLKRV